MIINKSCAFQLPSARQMRKKYFCVQKISKSPEEFCDFFRLASGDHESTASTESRSEKNGPSNRGAIWVHNDILFVNLWNMFQLRNDLLDGKSCQPRLSS